MNEKFKCFRCGFCCIKYDVVIIDDLKLGMVADIDNPEKNLKIKRNDIVCQHLVGDKPGELSCAAHNEEWYPETPCAQHGSENFGNGECNIGQAAMKTGTFAEAGKNIYKMIEEALCRRKT